MWVYYQTVEDCHQTWKSAPADQEPELRKGPAYHLSIYHLHKLAEACEDPDEIKYRGDLWFDIDHKPEEGESVHDALQRSIMDARRLLDYLSTLALGIDYCQVYASGSKGFHICVPARLFAATGTYQYLPKIHRMMAEAIQERAQVDGLDLSLYASGRGKLLRVAGKLRANDRYKVPVTWSEVMTMTPDMYDVITQAPRPDAWVEAPKSMTCHELCILFAESQEQVRAYSKMSFTVVASEHLSVFSEAHPRCIEWLVTLTAIKDGKGKFNGAKMSLARYVMSAPLSDESRTRLIERFAENWTSTRHKTADSRVKAVRETLKFGQEQGFSCEMMCRSFTENPCVGCPIKEVQRAESADRTGIVDQKMGYRRMVVKGEGPFITNFTLKPRRRYLDGEDANKFLAFQYDVIEQLNGHPSTTASITLDAKAWLSSSEFKKQLMRHMRLNFTGSDSDLQFLRAYLTSPEMSEGVETVKHVKTLGIHHHVDEPRGIDEFVWVQEDWSLGATISDTLVYNGTRVESGGITQRVVMDMRKIPDFDSQSARQEEVMWSLLNCNRPFIVSQILGWICACWLKEHFMAQGTNRHFPALHLWAASGVGKTETATLFALLGGSNYYQHDPLVVSGSTPYAIREEAAISTTAPRIFDEMNEHKIKEVKKYRAAAEAVKAAARGSALPQGAMGQSNQGIVIDQRLASSPIMFLATEENTEKELLQRSISVQLKDLYKLEPGHADHFEYARENEADLFPWTKALMLQAVKTDLDWVKKHQEMSKSVLPSGLRDRPARNWIILLVGLDFFEQTFMDTHRTSERIRRRLYELRNAVIDYLQANYADLAQKAEQQEIDVVMDKISELAAQVDQNNQQKLLPGVHYLVQSGQLHIFSTAVFPLYVKYMRDMGRTPQMSDLSQFKTMLNSRPYYLGEGLIRNVRAPNSWHSLELKGLKAKGVHIDNFQEG